MSNKKQKKKRVLLAMPRNWNLYIMIKQELECMGYDVSVVTNKFNFFDKIKIILNQIIKKENRLESTNDFLRKKINKYEHYDISLVILASDFRIDLLELMKQKSDLMISYQLDGMDRFGNIENKIKYFDKFYVFDKNDIEKYPQYDLKLSHNFYFGNSIKSQTNVNDNINIDFYYVAVYNESRVDVLNELSDFFNKNNISYKLDIFTEKSIENFKNRNANRLDKPLPYDDFIKKMAKSRYILDVVVSDHSGLSLRIIESMIYKKKVVTTNPTVKEYDFYNPQNIFIVGERPLEELSDFLKSDYCEIDQKILEKYSFENWFKEIIKN